MGLGRTPRHGGWSEETGPPRDRTYSVRESEQWEVTWARETA